MRLMSRALAPLAALAALLLALGAGASGCGGHGDAKQVPAKVAAFEGKDVVLDVRTSSFDKGALTFEAVVGNNEEHALVGLRVEVAIEGPNGAVLKTLDLSPIGTRAKLTVLEPNFEVAIHEVVKLDAAPTSVTARVVKAETFAEPADPPAALEVTGDPSGLEFSSAGHFRFDMGGDRAELPFRATIGIRNVGSTTIKRVEYGLRFVDEQGKEADRIPMNKVFEPPLRPGDAILDPVNAQVRAFDKLTVEVRAVHAD